MFRRYFLAGLVMLIIGGMVYSYQKFKRFNTPVSPILMAVPEGSALVIETSDVLNLWEKLTHTSVVWEDLKKSQWISQIHNTGAAIDSVFQADVMLKNHLKTRKAMVVVAPSGAQRYSLLFAVSTPPDWTDFKISETIKLFQSTSAETNERTYDGTPFHEVLQDGKPKFYWARKSGVLLISSSKIPVEEALRMLDAPTNLTENKSFQKVGKTAGLYAHANVYINYEQWGGFLKTFLNERGQNAPFFKFPLAEWSALDLTLRSSEIMLNGFVHVPDSSSHYFNVFAGQTGQDLSMARILPDNTAHLVYYGLSHFPSFYKRYQNLKRAQQQFFSYDQQRNEFNQRINGNAEDFCLSWIDSEMAVFITEPGHVSYDQLSYLALKSDDPSASIDLLKSLSTALGTTPEETEISGYSAFQLNLDNAYGILLGAPFDGFNEIFLTSLENYIIIAQSKGALRNLINFYQTKNTLHKDDNFTDFTENLSKRSNLLLYSGISRSPDLYSPFLTSHGVQALDNHLETVRNFEGFAYQLIESGDRLFYNNIFLRHNPVYTRESGAFWEIAMESDITFGPQLVLNHYTQSREILVQDEKNKLHLISNTGQILWSKNLEAPILGKVQQIDAYKNDKLQLLFNTREKVHLIDRNGNDVDGFPVKLAAAASAPLGLFDYDNNRDYRILVPCEDRELRLFDGLGKPIPGWKDVRTKVVMNEKPQHLRLGSKDYIFGIDSDGNVYLLNRQGKHRHRVKTKIEGRSDNPAFIREGKNIQNSELLYTDTTGNLVVLKFDDNIEKHQLFKPQAHQFLTADLNKDGRHEIVVSTAEEVMIFNIEGDQICSHDAEGVHFAPTVYQQADGKTWVGILDSGEEAIYLMDEKCNLYTDFPLFARGSFTIGDINKDGVINVVAIGEPNVIYTYNLD